MTTYTGFGSETPAGLEQATGDSGNINLGTRFHVTGTGLSLTKIRYYQKGTPGSGSGIVFIGALFAADADGATGTALVQANFGTVNADSWNEIAVTPYALTSGVDYYAVLFAKYGLYTYKTGGFSSEITSGPIVFPAHSATTENGTFRYSGALEAPANTYGPYWWGVDVEVDDGGSGGTDATVTPAAVAAACAVPAAQVSVGLAAAITATAVTATVPVATVGVDATITPSAVTAVAVIAAASLSSGATSVPSVVAGLSAAPSPSIQATTQATVTPAAVAATAAVPSPAVITPGGATITPMSIATSIAVPPAQVQALTTSSRGIARISVVSMPSVSV